MISIIIPAYNIRDYIKYSVESILQQNFTDYEIILVDDGSTDGTSDICDRYGRNYSQIRVIHQTNGGLSAARNTGINASVGEYILFLDGDDYLSDGALQLLSNLISESGKQLDFIQYKYEEVTNYTPHYIPAETPNLDIVQAQHEMYSRLLMLGGIGASACTKLIHRNVLSELKFKEGIIHEDEYFTTHLIERSQNVGYIDSVLYNYVCRENSIIRSKFTNKNMDKILIYEDRLHVLKRLGYVDLIRKTYEKYFIELVVLYVRARNTGFSSQAKTIRTHINHIVSTQSLHLQGTMNYLFRGIKIGLPVLPLYRIYYKLLKTCHE